MTPLSGAVSSTSARPVLYWGIAGLLALFFHVAAALPFFLTFNNRSPSSPPPAPFLVDISDLSTSQSSTNQAPGPEQMEASPSQESPPEEQQKDPDPEEEPEVEEAVDPIDEPEPEQEEDLESEIAQESPKEEQEQKEPPVLSPVEQTQEVLQEVNQDQSAPETTGAPEMDLAPTENLSAPVSGVGQQQIDDAKLLWQNTLQAYLERRKRYPRQAQIRRQEGVAWVTFIMDRQGEVVSAELLNGTGFDSLDKETIELIWRASPLPPPPDEIVGETLTLTFPMYFTL